MNKQTTMEWAGYVLSIAGLMVMLLTFDHPVRMWPLVGMVAMLVGLLLVYRSRRRRHCDDRDIDAWGRDGDDAITDLIDDD